MKKYNIGTKGRRLTQRWKHYPNNLRKVLSRADFFRKYGIILNKWW